MRLCSIKKCNNKHNAKGFCTKHLARYRKYGDPDIVLIKREHPEKCIIKGCDGKYLAKGLCVKHYWRMKKELNPEIKEKERLYTRSWRKRLVLLLGGRCVRCGFVDLRALQLDHIHGGGNYQLRTVYKQNATRLYKEYFLNEEKARKDLQVLCANCNWIKRSENNENRYKNGKEISFKYSFNDLVVVSATNT